MTDSTIQQTSTALRANLAETRRDVVVPPRFAALLDAVAELAGVRQTTEKVLTEYFHPLRNVASVVTDLATLVEGKFSYFAASDQGAVCAGAFVDLFVELFGQDLPPASQSRLIRGAADFLMQLDLSPGADEAPRLLDALAACLEQNPRQVFPAARLLRTVGRSLSASGPLASRWRVIYRTFMERSLRILEAHVAVGLPASAGPAWPEAVARGVRTDLTQALAALAAADDDALFDLPTLDDAVDLVLGTVRRQTSPSVRIDCCMRLSSLPELEYRYRDVQQDLDVALAQLLNEGGDDALGPVVDALTGYLPTCPPEQKRPLFTTLERLGRGLAGEGHRRAREGFIDLLVANGFESPDVSGVSEDWQVRVNPFHLPYVRTWLAIIQSDPGSYERLLSALVVNLHVRGIFVSDTDLFQRDISALLASGVGEVFHLVMQLVAFIPVFFNEIGSEGELRQVSTRIDQLTNRSDHLTHFLRKQCHAEPNNRLIAFSEAVLWYWMSADPAPLEPYVPAPLLAELPQNDLPWFRGARAALLHLTADCGLTVEDLTDHLSYDALQQHLASFAGADDAEKERVVLLIRLRRLLVAKYSAGSEELLDALSRSPAVDDTLARRFRSACQAHDPWGMLLEGTAVLRSLKEAITRPGPSPAYEDIYYKRHIAVGIPSMYGTYRESRFDAMGHMTRVMKLLRPVLEGLVDDIKAAVPTKTNLLRAYRLLRTMLAGLSVGGLRVDNLSSKVELLKRSLWVGNFSATQFLNVVEFIAQALGDVIDATYIAVHETNVRAICRAVAAEEGVPSDEVGERADGMAESFLRTLMTTTYGLQPFDRFVNALRSSLTALTRNLDEDGSRVVLNYSQDKLVSMIHAPLADHEDQLILGAKGLTLKKLHGLGLPIPKGFILSTELFNVMPVMAYEDLHRDTDARLRAALATLETDTGLRLGDGTRPLLVSVRSGAAISMPGMMDTVINVGLSRAGVETWASRPGYEWTAWDCYRRYIQSYAMSLGTRDRNSFDALILQAKERFGVERKVDFTPPQMREIALAYETLAADAGVPLPDDPFEQVLRAVRSVLGSWEAPTARAYRHELDLSDQWGTAVIVQAMVLGNLSGQSGTGALFTTDPRSPSARVELFGDFVTCSQGEDVVSGLVSPLPLSEKQRRLYANHLDVSLERLHPATFARLRDIATSLVREGGFEHQEMEFTFESERPEDLFILQSRPMTTRPTTARSVFCGGDDLDASRMDTGVGVAGGALSGRAAFTRDDITALRRSSPDEPVILLRPDTVPEDIPLIMAADGVLTARGGVTSHAAVTAKRLDKPCVVNCRELIVREDEGLARLGAAVIRAGDWLSLDGLTGAVYLGEHDIRTAQRALRLF